MICNKCGIEKPNSEFIKNKKCKQGVAATCKKCKNEYTKDWKNKNKERISARRKELYDDAKREKTKEKKIKSELERPLFNRCALMRNGMLERSKLKRLDFDSKILTTSYLMERIGSNPYCECCNKKLDISKNRNQKFKDDSPSVDRVNPKLGYTINNVAILCWRCNKHKQAASSSELRMIADYIDNWNSVGTKDE